MKNAPAPRAMTARSKVIQRPNPEVVVKAGLAEAVGQDAEGGISAPQADRGHGNKMQQEFQQRTTRAPFREEGGVDGLVVVFHFH